MKAPLLDTNVIVRFFVETPETMPRKFVGVYPFFEALERGDRRCLLADVVIFQCYYVMTSYYEAPHKLVVEQLIKLCKLRGIHLQNRAVMLACLDHLLTKKTDFVDAYLCALSQQQQMSGIYSFDKGFEKMGLALLAVTGNQ